MTARIDARLSAAELEVVNATKSPAIELASDEKLKVLAQRLRRARDRATDVDVALNAKCVERLTQGGSSPLETTRVHSQRPKCWRRLSGALWRS